MKHAYLIIAHSDFDVLSALIEELDDPRNDIYIHFDRKVKKLPPLDTIHSPLEILLNRVDVRWGHFSQIEAEYALFEAAHRNKNRYSYYHLISGTHFPLKSQDEIHRYFRQLEGKEVLTVLKTDNYEINFKLGRYHFFIRFFRSDIRWKATITQLLWRLILRMQYFFKLKKQQPNVHFKAQNWVSIGPHAINELIRLKNSVFSLFRYSFCGDEYLLPFIIANGDNLQIELRRDFLYTEFADTGPRQLTTDDYDAMVASNCIFARKISSKNMELIKRIKENMRLSQDFRSTT